MPGMSFCAVCAMAGTHDAQRSASSSVVIIVLSLCRIAFARFFTALRLSASESADKSAKSAASLSTFPSPDGSESMRRSMASHRDFQSDAETGSGAAESGSQLPTATGMLA